jgi:phosphoribosyl-ATP pyrophosphohydrolase
MKTGLAETLERIAALIETRKKADPKTSYVAKAPVAGRRRRAEEDRRGGHRRQSSPRRAASGCIWCAKLPTSGFTAWSCSRGTASGPGDVLAELHRREGISGLDEKAARKHDQRT